MEASHAPQFEGISPTEYLRSQIEFWETYHHHKEQMAFTVTALFLTATAALTFLEIPALTESPFASWLIFLVLALITAGAGLFFVNWQLSLREVAAAMLRGCGVLVVRWLTRGPSMEDLGYVTTPDGRPMTKALLAAYQEAKGSYKWHQSPRTIRLLTLVVLFIWAAVALVHILYVGYSSGVMSGR